jgi:spore coat protein CotH
MQNFDVKAVLSYMAVINWAGVWDDGIHNHLLYRNGDGKWLVTPTDFDQDFGTGNDDGSLNPRQLATASFYIGEQGNPNNGNGANLVKDAFFKTFKPEFNQRLLELDATVLKPDNVIKVLNDSMAAFSMKDWMADPATRACDAAARMDRIRQWAPARHAALLQQIRP